MMNASILWTTFRKRLIAVGIAVMLIVATVMSYPAFSDSQTNANLHHPQEMMQLAGPQLGSGGGGGGG